MAVECIDYRWEDQHAWVNTGLGCLAVVAALDRLLDGSRQDADVSEDIAWGINTLRLAADLVESPVEDLSGAKFDGYGSSQGVLRAIVEIAGGAQQNPQQRLRRLTDKLDEAFKPSMSADEDDVISLLQLFSTLSGMSVALAGESDSR